MAFSVVMKGKVARGRGGGGGGGGKIAANFILIGRQIIIILFAILKSRCFLFAVALGSRCATMYINRFI